MHIPREQKTAYLSTMGLFVASLNSGSNGNCYYIGNESEAILVDGGISCRETEKRLKRLGLSIKKVKAIFVTHEHGDHIHGVPVLSRRHKLPVYITQPTLQNGGVLVEDELVHPFRPYEAVRIGNLTVTGFPKLHDACDPHSFIVSDHEVTVGVFTDIGAPCSHVTKHFQQCHAAFLESNYDEHMLETGRYPYHLKKRIRGGHGHLSNLQAMRLFIDHRPAFMSHLFLAHLSRDNNSPELARNMFTAVAGRTKVVVASRYHETEVYHIIPQDINPQFAWRNRPVRHQNQLTLF
jgi:phosphoribosyl 1,2-cyclic phosphodiesterase